MIVSNLERIRQTAKSSLSDSHPASRRNSKRHVNGSARAAVRQALRDPRTW
jgi:hypothetical protein